MANTSASVSSEGTRGEAAPEVRPRQNRGLPPASQGSAVAARILLLPALRGILEPCGCDGTRRSGLQRTAALVTELRHKGEPLLILAVGPVFSLPLQVSADDALMSIRQRQEELRQAQLAEVLDRLGVDLILTLPEHRPAQEARLAGRLTQVRFLDPGTEPRRWALGELALLFKGPRSMPQQHEDASALTVLVERSHNKTAGGDARDMLEISLGATPSLRVLSEGVTSERHPLGEPTDSPILIELARKGDDLRVGRVLVQTLDEHAPVDAQLQVDLERFFSQLSAMELPAPAIEHGGAAGVIGSRTCAACHPAAYLWWQGTRHGTAFASLQERRRDGDLSCVPCHVTRLFEPSASATVDLGERTGVGCESCHGAGSLHSERPLSNGLPATVSVAICAACHDALHDPDFDADARMSDLAGVGHGSHGSSDNRAAKRAARAPGD